MALLNTGVSAEGYEQLSDVYLMLWRQLENVARDNKWLDIRSDDGATLQGEVRRAIETMNADRSSVVFSDYQRTQQLLLNGPHANAPEIAVFREYLRDNALRYAQLATELMTEAEDRKR